MSRRTEYDIRADILNLCRVPQRKTPIVYGCNLNFKIVKRYFAILKEEGHLVENDGTFQTTEDGCLWVDNAAVIGVGSGVPMNVPRF